MKTSFHITLIFMVSMTFFSCKSDIKTSSEETVKTTISETSKKEKNEKTRKTATINMEAVINGENFSLTDYDPVSSTDVVFLDNGIQFRINDVNKQGVLVNMYAPDLLKQIPITISQQTSALKPEEAYNIKTQSRLEIVIPSKSPVQGDTKVLLQGTVSLEALSENKLTVIFTGNGFALGSNKKNLFPMQGKIVLENFNVYDGRMQ
ncbi:MAG: hypothetical protein GW839_00020 [Flavobacteriales bacterium]|nr:hypothetical protein [Flavobacteriia bacterium]NCP06809.1 hypothetical protein [Flavobacteriales bacterium]PIV92945.1 MAG: hypothetical protein COW44_12085 [Flavobacteriaceae bacterium CG17_big_fil_post_rev_8_21_14_2_50_33_15]PIY12302.1 MAG: hypothetical protein COZ17_04005 [Flavobacteriaceae bacterium CG_4_10_14_3_um_filter_33_47]PJB19528.1 MAG: hypothetical protein CO117_04265 [Flavobacteriaceae bacterium CG_4_9_14_3_um_filter_33_16]